MKKLLSRRYLQSLAALVLAATVATSAATPALAAPPKLPHASPEEVGMDPEVLNKIDADVNKEIEAENLPGAVVLISHKGKVVFLRAYGNRQVKPEIEAMPTDAIFDMASVTKPVATGVSVMLLVEQGKLELDEKAAKYWPEFGVNGKENITVRDLLTHVSGLIPDNSIRDYEQGRAVAIEKVAGLGLRAQPRERFMYSDVGFIVLAELVKRVTGEDIDEFSRKNLFEPLGMADSSYGPLPQEVRARVVPTAQRNDEWIRGEVHDPRAHYMDGIAGHAGLFSTAEDLAVFGQMLINGGTYEGVKVLSPETIDLMSTRNQVPGEQYRGLGWDMQSGFSSNRGKNFSDRSIGHGGFTGTAFWVDPVNEVSVVFLSSRLHPNGKGAVNQLAGRIGTTAVDAIKKADK